MTGWLSLNDFKFPVNSFLKNRRYCVCNGLSRSNAALYLSKSSFVKRGFNGFIWLGSPGARWMIKNEMTD